jgi:hypothetical protein
VRNSVFDSSGATSPVLTIHSYSKIIQRMFGDGPLKRTDPVAKLLSWLVCAKRSLKWYEIQCISSVDLKNTTVDWERKSFRVDSKELCGSLVAVHTDNTISLVHHTAKR